MIYEANMTQTDPNETYTNIPTAKILLWLAMVSMVMLFAGLTSAYVVRQAEGNWTHFEIPVPFFISTILIVASSATMQWAYNSVKKNDLQKLRTGLLITLALGFGFSISQFIGWSGLVAQGIYFVGNPSGSFFYVITAFHMAHLAGGILYLIYVAFRSIQNRYHKGSNLAVELCAVYWHFLDGLWLYLFVFLYFIR